MILFNRLTPELVESSVTDPGLDLLVEQSARRL